MTYKELYDSAVEKFDRDLITLDEYEKMIERLNDEIMTAEPKWIPVTERLPKAGEYVGDVAKYYLVQNEYGDMLVARYTHSEYWEQIR